MITARQQQIVAAMTGRQASAVNDNALRDAVRSKLIELATAEGHPLQTNLIGGMVAKVLENAARTIIFEAEVTIALEMGAAGELDVAGNINQTNVGKWVTTYAVCGDRRAAQNYISIQSARDRARTDSVASDELRREFEQNGLRRAWQTFIEEGGWNFIPGYAAALYGKIGVAAIRALVPQERIDAARADALAACRRDYPQKYRTAPQAEIEATDVFRLHSKAQLCRAYFEELRSRSLDISYKPNNS